jgi:hypothetical protein
MNNNYNNNKKMNMAMTTTLVVLLVVAAAAATITTTTATTVAYAQTTTTTTPGGGGGGTIPLPTNITNPVTGEPLTPTTQQIIIDLQTQCRDQGVIILQDCVSVWHESPTTLVLNGDTLLLASPGSGPIGSTGTAEDLFGEEDFASSVGNYPNVYLWEAVDRFKAQGYTLTSVLMGGQGTQGNPDEFFVVMSK